MVQSFLHAKLIHNLCYILNIRDNSSILLAISCGQDSLCLLQLFIDLKNILNLNLAILYIDHQWREDSNDNTKHIINMTKKLDCPLYIYQLNPRKYSEAEFRDMRYQIYIETACRYTYDTVATAHTSSDVTETCLIQIVKGSNIDSLNSLRWKRQIYENISLVRPLLNFTRAEITWFCKYYQLPIWSDYTNIYYTCNRNRLRHELIPYLKQYHQIDIEKNIHRFLRKTYYDTEYLRQTTIKIYLSIKHPLYAAFNYKLLLIQHKCVQLRVLHIFLAHNTNITWNYESLDHIIHRLNRRKNMKKSRIKIQLKTYNNWAYLL
uniref:tRNA(Ile)-lysidine synthase, chloroplastic n=1 Tax=Neoizziella asiatica TaxID=1077397 RepID=A0A1G4NWT7_9FLOR|nr:tRNA Ile-lysidine synthetase [Neoizziella asiatica]SCW23130.1 tRNA Ile-lysidine synthetase [Neoizziella asiatica]